MLICLCLFVTLTLGFRLYICGFFSSDHASIEPTLCKKLSSLRIESKFWDQTQKVFLQINSIYQKVEMWGSSCCSHGCYTLCEMLQNTSNLVLVIRKYFSFVQSQKCFDATITASCRKDAVCCITTRSKRALHKDFCIITWLYSENIVHKKPSKLTHYQESELHLVQDTGNWWCCKILLTRLLVLFSLSGLLNESFMKF